jgi:hypothetical protein
MRKAGIKDDSDSKRVLRRGRVDWTITAGGGPDIALRYPARGREPGRRDVVERRNLVTGGYLLKAEDSTLTPAENLTNAREQSRSTGSPGVVASDAKVTD